MNKMVKYADIVDLNSSNLEKSIESISEFIDSLPSEHKEVLEKELIKQMGIFSNGHFTKESACYILNKMKHFNSSKSMKEILDEKGITLENARILTQEAYNRARDYGNQHGFNAPTISENYNEYDYLVSFAMCISDFWYTGAEDSSQFASLNYQWMSDVNSKCSKIWDYFFD